MSGENERYLRSIRPMIWWWSNQEEWVERRKSKVNKEANQKNGVFFTTMMMREINDYPEAGVTISASSCMYIGKSI